jgi:hypothetical protein
MIKLNLVDDYQAEAIPSADVPCSPSGADEFEDVIIVYIQDDFGKAKDEYILITEDGFIISLEDFENQDEIAIVVRVK